MSEFKLVHSIDLYPVSVLCHVHSSCTCHVFHCAGPLVSFLLRRFSCRQVTIFGTLLSTVGFVASMFAPNIETLIITYGVVGGEWVICCLASVLILRSQTDGDTKDGGLSKKSQTRAHLATRLL